MRLLKITPWLLLGISLLTFIAQVGLQAAGCAILIDDSVPQPSERYGLVMIPLSMLGLALIGTLVLANRDRNRIGWLLSVSGMTIMLSFLGTQYGRCYALGDMALPYPGPVFWLADFTFVIGFSIIAIYLPLLFPTGTYLSPRWRVVGVWAAILIAVTSVYRLFFANAFFDVSGRPVENLSNPFSLSVQVPAWLDSVFTNAQTAVMLLFTLLAFISLFWRWRVADVEKKQQLKWLIYYLCIAGFLFIGVETMGTFLYPQIFDGWFYLIELLLFWLGLPLVLGIAILRYRLWDIDVIIRKTLVYGLLTALLALVYFGAVILLQSILEAVSGQQSAVSIVISTLIIAALFAPLRRRVQDFIDRRFYRRRYDAERTLANFGQFVRDETDIKALTAELLRVTEETMQPEQATLWLNLTIDEQDRAA